MTHYKLFWIAWLAVPVGLFCALLAVLLHISNSLGVIAQVLSRLLA